MVKQLCLTFGSNDFKRVRNEALEVDYMQLRSLYEMIHNPKQLYLLYKRYKNEFPRGRWNHDNIPTPLICACEKGRMNDVKQFINLHGFHAYINMDVAEGSMDVKAMVSQLGYNSGGNNRTPLIEAAWKEHTNIVEYLLQHDADVSITDSNGMNVLHRAARYNRTNTNTIQLLLNKMSLNDINHKTNGGLTPLDGCYIFNNSSII